MKTIILLLISVNSFAQNLSLFDGTWTMKVDEGEIIERWERETDSSYFGVSMSVSGKDSTILENITLEFIDGKLHYIPVVKGQNDGKPVRFTLVSTDREKFIFENPQHDFPQRIIYLFKNEDELEARIEGIVNGNERTSVFYFRKQ